MSDMPLMEMRPDVGEVLAQGRCPMPITWAGAFVTCGVRFDAPTNDRCDHAADDYRLMLAWFAVALEHAKMPPTRPGGEAGTSGRRLRV